MNETPKHPPRTTAPPRFQGWVGCNCGMDGSIAEVEDHIRRMKQLPGPAHHAATPQAGEETVELEQDSGELRA